MNNNKKLIYAKKLQNRENAKTVSIFSNSRMSILHIYIGYHPYSLNEIEKRSNKIYNHKTLCTANSHLIQDKNLEILNLKFENFKLSSTKQVKNLAELKQRNSLREDMFRNDIQLHDIKNRIKD